MADLNKTIEYAEETLSKLHPDEKDKDHIGLMVKVGFMKDAVELLKEYQKVVHCGECRFAQMTPVSYPQDWCIKKNNYMNSDCFCTDGKRKDGDHE